MHWFSDARNYLPLDAAGVALDFGKAGFSSEADARKSEVGAPVRSEHAPTRLTCDTRATQAAVRASRRLCFASWSSSKRKRFASCFWLRSKKTCWALCCFTLFCLRARSASSAGRSTKPPPRGRERPSEGRKEPPETPLRRSVMSCECSFWLSAGPWVQWPAIEKQPLAAERTAFLFTNRPLQVTYQRGAAGLHSAKEFTVNAPQTSKESVTDDLGEEVDRPSSDEAPPEEVLLW
eukprot:CAMPEP_0115148970 /NCGR_PEP_ID=MMETSP0227-20121206/64183_1 /TAXON_ID=89957 /ORGANISM="Polarella glacialis, Strain CCMP 1383" /LENGTH=234 /DNA_ID=CAMNT_0002559091 /DNA_START=322 /DNA_END=1027 /DNA_ORIENTATION=-